MARLVVLSRFAWTCFDPFVNQMELLFWNNYVTSQNSFYFFGCRPNCNVFGYIDWTTGLLLSDNSTEVYSEQQQSQQHQPHLPPQPPPPLSLPPPPTLPPQPTQSSSHHAFVQHQQSPPSIPQSLAPVVQLTSTSTHFTPSYTIAPTTEIVNFTATGSSYQLQQNLSSSSNYLTSFVGEPSFSSDQHRTPTYVHRYPFGHQYPSPATPSDSVGCSTLFSVPIPGPSRHSDSFPVMASRAKSKGKDRSNKRGTSVMSWVLSDFWFVFLLCARPRQ